MKTHLVTLVNRFTELETPRLAAALAFYLSVLFAPLVIIFVALSASVSSSLALGLETQVVQVAGADAGQMFHSVMLYAKEKFTWTSGSGILAFLFFLILASLIFGELRADLNKIFSVQKVRRPQGAWHWLVQYLREQISHIGLVLAFVFLMFVTLAGSSLLNAVHFGDLHLLLVLFDIAVTWIFYSMSFILMIRFVPDERQSWSRALKGGILIATLFTIGKELVGLYLGKSAINSVYGPAGAGIAFLAWVYYCATIVFFGAEASSLIGKNTGESPTFAKGPLA